MIPGSPLPSLRRLPRAFPLYTAAALLVAIVSLWAGLRSYQTVMNTRAWDIVVDWNAARGVRMLHLNPYSDEGLKALGASRQLGFGHPPTSLVWLLPFADLDLQSTKRVWNELTMLFLFLHLFIVVSELKLPSPLVSMLALAGLVLCTSWMRSHLDVSQLSELIAFLYVVAWYFLRRGRDLTAGAMLGLATTLKFYPGVVVLFFLLQRRWRLVLGALLAWLAVALPITLRIGAVSWFQFLQQSKPYTLGWLTNPRNASLQGIVQQLQFPVCRFEPAVREPWAMGTYLASALSVALIAIVAWVVKPTAKNPRRVDLPFALFALTSLITGPYMWEHYNVTLIQPILISVVGLARARRAGLRWRWVAAGAAALTLVIGVLSIHGDAEIWYPYVGRHIGLHIYQVAKWISSPLLILLLSLLLRWAIRHAPAVLDDFSLEVHAPAP